MQKSEQINDLAKALCLAQSELENASKDSKGNFGSYASLASVRNSISPALNKNGLSIIQPFGHDEIGDFIETILMHASGQWISGRLYLKTEKQTMQGLGSAISYARRYSLAAIVNIGQEDDDAQQAEESPRKEVPTSPSHESRMQHPEKKAFPSSGPRPGLISAPQEKRLFAIASTNGWSNQEVLGVIKGYGYLATNQIDRKDYEEICHLLSKPKQLKAVGVPQPPPFSDEDIPF